MSNDLRKITPEHREVLLNERVIAIDQDPLVSSSRSLKFKQLIKIPKQTFKFFLIETFEFDFIYKVSFCSRHKKFQL